MAAPARRLATNAPGDFFVAANCIDCDTCNWLAPDSFADGGDGHSRVWRQPRDAAETARAERALVACPVGAIRSEAKRDLAAARAAFPERIDGPVHHCGWHAAASYGAAAYLVVRPGGNVLVDSPRFTSVLARRIAALGGVAMIFLTHRDDVADHARWAAEFGAERVIHAADVTAETRAVERQLDGDAPVALAPDLVALPVPGHTAGSMCLLAAGRYLFSGDHLAWSPEHGHLYAFRDLCWFDWAQQRRSMRRLADHEFEWVLPGHGWRAHFPAAAMRGEMARCLAWMDAA
jgi:glyoxylase-like metal-dependent hydrolase (beta-lactamase superfamily II)/ferredoxin